jgi:DNA polymerase-3 subunit gamma/tau
MLSKDAFNAFLKTLEEPPSHVIFILATTEKNKILPTILSRCQIYDFERMSVQNIINHLKGVAEKENITFEEKALSVIAEKADGGMRDALSIFDQAASFCQGNITYKKVIEDLNVLDEDNYFSFVDLALTNKVSEAMVLLNSLLSKGFDGNNLIVGLASHIRNVLMAKDSQTIKLLEISENQAKRYQEQAQKCPTPFLYTALKILNQCDLSYNSSSNKRLLVELTIIEVAQITQKDDDAPSAGRSPKRLKSLFKKLLFNQPKAVQQVTVADGTQTSAAPTSNAAGTNIPQQAKSQLNISPRNTAGKTTGNGSPRQRLKLSSIGNTFANLKNANDTNGNGANAANEIGNQDETNAFTDSELQLQWRLMCNRMPKQMVGIASRMRNMTPAITDYPNIEVAVDNQILLDQMKNIQERIKATLAKTLHNGNINLKLRLADETEIVKTLSKNDILELMKKESEPLTLLCEKFDLELS